MDIKEKEAFLQKEKKALQKLTAKNSKGFVLIFLMLILPLFVSLLFFLYSFFQSLKVYNRSLTACYLTSMIAQKQMSSPIKAILKLNPKAKRLREKLKKAQKKLSLALLSGKSVLIQKAKLKLLEIKRQQFLLMKEQKFYLLSLSKISKKSLEDLKRTLKKMAKKDMRNLRVFKNKDMLKKTPKNSLTPDYLPVYNFPDKQALRASFSVKGFSIHCGATLRKEKNKWKPTLYTKKDKFL